MQRSLIILSMILFTAPAGCTTTIIPPSQPAHPTTVLITNYGKHSSLLLPDPHGGLIEYAFGDYDWFALGKTNPIVAIHALIHSPQSTLGRRWIFIDADASDLISIVGAIRTEAVIVDGDKVAALRAKLNDEFDGQIDRMFYSRYGHLYFVPSKEPYNLFHNCNSETAEWLRQLGAGVHGFALWSDFRVEPGKTCQKMGGASK